MEAERPEDVTHEVTVDANPESDSDDEEKSMDFVMDTDGNQKKANVKYGGEEDLESDAGESSVSMSDKGELTVD